MLTRFLICFLVLSMAIPVSAQSFKADVEPLIREACIHCHDANTESELNFEELDYDLTHSDTLAMWQEVFDRLSNGEMPPEDEKRPDKGLLAPALQALRSQLHNARQAIQKQYWALRRLKRPSEPAVKSPALIRTPIDAFVLARLEAAGLSFAPQADRTTLVRRTYLDLIGLPPPPEAVARFCAEGSPEAYERMIDELLDSPHFGERWGRHWLDAVGHMDTEGFDGGATYRLLKGKWRYRDYVIESLNADKPYNEFVYEQICGDEQVDWRNAERFTPEIRHKLIATGFLRTAADFSGEGMENNIAGNHYATIHDTMDIVSTSLLGLSVKCARCHSHKFDPIPQEDYYRMMACLTPAYNPANWKIVANTLHISRGNPYVEDRSIPDVSAAEKEQIDKQNAGIDAQIEDLNSLLAAIREPYEEQLLESKLENVPEASRNDALEAVKTSAKNRSSAQKKLAAEFGYLLTVSPEEIKAVLSEEHASATAELEKRIATLNHQRKSWGSIQALYDVGPPPPSYVLLQGNHDTPGERVSPGFLTALTDEETFERWFSMEGVAGETSGRRTALARWITAPGSRASALLARVHVNRIWQHLLGEGIVATPDNFGAGGSPPTHPELLDWLSDEFVAGGWTSKPLIKAIMMSTVYRQVSSPALMDRAAVESATTKDPDNKLLWRMRLRRLEPEIIRDSVLAISGQINLRMGGPPVPIKTQPNGMVVVDEERLPEPEDRYRRSIYLLSRRSFNPTILTTFDLPFIATTCTTRIPSAVVSQSLTMWNDAFIFEQAERFAERVAASSPTASRRRRIESAFQLALGRKPVDAEVDACEKMLTHHVEVFRNETKSDDIAKHQALVQLCHAVLNTSEFLYVQ